MKVERPSPKKVSIRQLVESEKRYYSVKEGNHRDNHIHDGKYCSRELLFHNIDETVNDEKTIYELLKEIFNIVTKEETKLHVSRIKFIYFQGKYSALVRFGDCDTAAYLYFNFYVATRGKTKAILGQNFTVYVVVENNIKTRKDDWIAVVIRGLNLQIEKEHIVNRLKEKLGIVPLWDELLQLKHYKYALIGVKDIEEAEKICKHFKYSSDLRQKIKANIHPHSSKKRKDKTKNFKSFLFLEDQMLDKNKIELNKKESLEDLKEQLKQKVLDLKSRKSNQNSNSTPIPFIINAFENNNNMEIEEEKKDSNKFQTDIEPLSLPKPVKPSPYKEKYYNKKHYNNYKYKEKEDYYKKKSDYDEKKQKNKSHTRSRSRSKSNKKKTFKRNYTKRSRSKSESHSIEKISFKRNFEKRDSLDYKEEYRRKYYNYEKNRKKENKAEDSSEENINRDYYDRKSKIPEKSEKYEKYSPNKHSILFRINKNHKENYFKHRNYDLNDSNSDKLSRNIEIIGERKFKTKKDVSKRNSEDSRFI